MRRAKPYTSNSLPAAIREVRMLRKLRGQLSELLEQYARERKLLAMLAADVPQFDNPLKAWEAKELRDQILGHDWGRTMPEEQHGNND